jgi:hypothetical protein
MNQRTGTHGARLNCSKEVAIDEAVITEVLRRFAQGYDFGVSGWVVVGEIAVIAAANDAALEDNYGAYRDFAGREGALSATDGFFHPDFVGGPRGVGR